MNDFYVSMVNKRCAMQDLVSLFKIGLAFYASLLIISYSVVASAVNII